MKNNGKIGFIYLIVLLLIIFSASYFLSAGTGTEYKYSDITQFFYDEQVSSFTVDSTNTLTLTLKNNKKIEYQLLVSICSMRTSTTSSCSRSRRAS